MQVGKRYGRVLEHIRYFWLDRRGTSRRKGKESIGDAGGERAAGKESLTPEKKETLNPL